MEISDPPSRGLLHVKAVALHPVSIAQNGLGTDRRDGDRLRLASRSCSQGQFYLPSCEILEIAEEIVLSGDFTPIDSQQKVALLDVDPGA